MTWRGYIAIENLALTAAQRNALAAILRGWGANHHPRPDRRNHIRIRLDNQAIILEAQFRRANLTADRIASILANIYSIPQTNIVTTTQSTPLGPMATFSYSGTDRLRFLIFAGLSATWEESRTAAVQYIQNNLNEWENPNP